MPSSHPLTRSAWMAARRQARWQIIGRSALVLAQGLILGIEATPILGFLTGPEKALWLVLATANFFWAILAVERLLELRPLRAEDRPGVIAREGLVRVQAREGEVPLLVLDALDLEQERWRGQA